MSAALSLLDDDPFDERTPAQTTPAPVLSSVPTGGDVTGQIQREATDPEALRDRETISRAAKSGGITVPLLIVSTLVSSPALYQFLVKHSITISTMLERWVLITLGCWLVAEAAQFYMSRAEHKTPSAAAKKAAVEEESVQPFGDLDDPLGDLP